MSARRSDQLAEITRELRADDWWPREKYLCGCAPAVLCDDHDRLRLGATRRCHRCGHPYPWRGGISFGAVAELGRLIREHYAARHAGIEVGQ